MAVIGPVLKWLEEFSSSWVFPAKDHKSSPKDPSEALLSLSSARLLLYSSSSSTSPTEAHGSWTGTDFQKGLNSGQSSFRGGDYGRPQLSSDSINKRRQFYPDVD